MFSYFTMEQNKTKQEDKLETKIILNYPVSMEKDLINLKDNVMLRKRLGGALTKTKLIKYAIHNLIMATKQQMGDNSFI